jgi:hypothetical protein
VGTVSFILFASIIQAEQRRGKRFLLVGFRSWLDKIISAAERWMSGTSKHFIRYVVQLSWYYSLHSLLRTVLHVIVASYEYFEKIFERNRLRTKELRAEKFGAGTANHLREMAVHKEETALSQVQQNKRKKAHLEGDN